MIYIKLTYPILLRTNLNIISFGCLLMVSNKERTKTLTNVAIAAIIVLSTSGPLLAGIQAHARPGPVHYCRIHPFAPVCHVRPGPVPYCRIHPFAPVCHPPVSYCRIHPFAPVCHVRPVLFHVLWD